LAELDVDAALPHTALADTGEIGLAAGLEREAAVHDVVPAVPLRHAGRIHGTDEIAQALSAGDADLLGADAVHLGNGQVREAPGNALYAGGQLRLGQAAVVVAVDGCKRLGQQAL